MRTKEVIDLELRANMLKLALAKIAKMESDQIGRGDLGTAKNVALYALVVDARFE